MAGERAWISVDVTPAGPLQFHPLGGLSLEIGVHIKNIGKTPALNVHTDVDDISLDLEPSAERLRAFANEKRVINTTASRLLLPDQQYERRWVPMANPKESDTVLFPSFSGTVTYQLSADSSLHQTSWGLSP